MQALLSPDAREKVCEKLRSVKAENTQASEALCQAIERMVKSIRAADKISVSDALANEGLLPSKFRASAMKVEQLVLDGILSPEGYGVTIYDAFTCDADPWEMIKLRGWEAGEPSPEAKQKLQEESDKLRENFERIMSGKEPPS